MPIPLSFNQWLSLQTTNPDGRIAALAKLWDTRRGRITADTVALRAEKYGLGGLAGRIAYGAYKLALLESARDEATAVAAFPTDPQLSFDRPIPYSLTESGAI